MDEPFVAHFAPEIVLRIALYDVAPRATARYRREQHVRTMSKSSSIGFVGSRQLQKESLYLVEVGFWLRKHPMWLALVDCDFRCALR